MFGVSLIVLFRQPALEDTSIRPRSIVPSEANISLEWTTDPARSEEWRHLAETTGVDVRALALGGDWSWVETAAELQDWFFVEEEQRSCNLVYGGAIDGLCSYTISYVVRSDGNGLGDIVYVESALRDEHSVPPASSENDSNCGNYVGCIARARLGVVIPLPEATRDSELVAIHEHLQSHWGIQSSSISNDFQNSLTSGRNIGIHRSKRMSGAN